MISAPKSGKRSAVFRSVSTPTLVGPYAMTYSSSTKLRVSTTFNASKYFFLNSSKYPITILKNGVLAGGAFTSTGSNSVHVAALTANIAGVSTTVSAGTITGISVPASGRKIYALIVSGGAVAKITGVSGTASSSYGASGGPPLVSSTAVVLGYVIRDSADSATIAATAITMISYGGREWANKFHCKNLRPLVGQLDLYQALPLQHSGSQGAKFYWKGYHFNGNEAKISQGKEWSLGVSQNRQDTNTQGSFAELSDGGKVSHSFSLSKLVDNISPAIFNHMIDPDLQVDNIVKCYLDQTDTTRYYAFQAGMDADLSSGMDDAISKDITGNVTGFAEYIDENV